MEEEDVLEKLRELEGQRVKVCTGGGQEHTAFLLEVHDEVVVMAAQPDEKHRLSVLRVDAIESVHTLAASQSSQRRF